MNVSGVELTDDEVLCLFEWAHRLCEANKPAFSHPAEAVVVDKIAGELERTLTEPFQKSYSSLLGEAREKVMAEYESKMGSDTWIHKLPMDQS